ncbi:MAG: NAD-binding protein [Actinomycetes bacterium]
MKIIIAGAGSVGRYMAEQLSSTGNEVTLIDSDANAISRVNIAGVTVTLGDACEVDTLSKAGSSNADVVAAVTGDDEDNLVISLLAKQEFAVPRVVARVNNPNNEWMFNEMWGVDVAVSTPHLLTAMVEEAVSIGSLVRIMKFEHGKAQLAEVTLAAGSPAIGTRIADLGLPRETTVVAIMRDGHVLSPQADIPLHQGDEVVVLLTGDVEQDVRRVLIGNSAS